MNIYIVIADRVLLGMDGFFSKINLGSQIRVFIFGISLWIAWGDPDMTGNQWSITLELPHISKVI